jgi:flagellar FliL protein
MAKAPAKPAADGEAPKSNKKLIIIVAAAALVLGAGGGGAAWYFMGASHGSKEAKHEAPKPPVFVNLEPFTVNLQPEGSEQYLQIGIVVQVDDDKTAELLKQYMPQVRSRLLMLLSSKHAEEIASPEGKKKLTEEVIAQLKEPFVAQEKPQGVNGVHFTEFVIQ